MGKAGRGNWRATETEVWQGDTGKGGFPCGSAGKQSARHMGDPGSIPGLGRSPGEGKGCPLQYSGLENFMDSIVHVVTKSRTRIEWLSLSQERGPWSDLRIQGSKVEKPDLFSEKATQKIKEGQTPLLFTYHNQRGLCYHCLRFNTARLL